MTAVEAWCGVTGNDCYPSQTELRWMAFALLSVAAVLLIVTARRIWEDR